MDYPKSITVRAKLTTQFVAQQGGLDYLIGIMSFPADYLVTQDYPQANLSKLK